MDGVLDQLNSSTVSTINLSITNSISAACVETLNLVRSITSHYRHTNKQAPTEPSYFIPNIFKPFHSFVEQNKDWTDTEIQLQWAQVVTREVITEYTSVVGDLFKNLNLTDEKLKNNKKVGEMSDEDKIRLQIYLDVQQLGQEV
jgi:endo-1,4-beta-D-glucanase Y